MATPILPYDFLSAAQPSKRDRTGSSSREQCNIVHCLYVTTSRANDATAWPEGVFVILSNAQFTTVCHEAACRHLSFRKKHRCQQSFSRIDLRAGVSRCFPLTQSAQARMPIGKITHSCPSCSWTRCSSALFHVSGNGNLARRCLADIARSICGRLSHEIDDSEICGRGAADCIFSRRLSSHIMPSSYTHQRAIHKRDPR
jgi:hypothetical protein